MALERSAIVQNEMPGPRIGSASQHSALRGQKTATRAREAGGTEHFTFDDMEVPATRERPGDFLPQERVLQRTMEYVDAPSLDVPALRVDEVVEGSAYLASVLTESPQVIVQETPDAQVFSFIVRASQPMNDKQVLDVPVLHMNQ